MGKVTGLYLNAADLERTTDYITKYIAEHNQPEEGAVITAYMEQYEEYFTDIDQIVELQTIITGTIEWMISIRRTVTIHADTPDHQVSGRRRLALAVQAQTNNEEEDGV